MHLQRHNDPSFGSGTAQRNALERVSVPGGTIGGLMEGEGGREADPKTVLIVDDEPALRLLCRVNLELEGHRALEASSLAEAREILASQLPDVMLLDVHLGSEIGLDLLEDIDSLELPTQVVLLSGSSRISAELRARVAGGPREAVRSRRARGRRRRGRTPRQPEVASLREREHHHGPQSRRVRGASLALPLRAVRGGARGPRRGEGDLGAGGDRRAVPRPLLVRPARRPA